MDVVNRPPVLGSLKFLTGPLAGSTLPISKPITTIGRDEASNDIVISDPAVSRHHARIVQNGSKWHVEKLAPQNTVTVNSRDVQQAPISDRDTIGLGTGTTFVFEAVVPSPSYAPPAGASSPAWAAGQPPMPYPVPAGNPAPPWANQQPAVPYTPQPISPSLPTPQPPAYGGGTEPDGGTQRMQPGMDLSAFSGVPSGVPSIEISTNIHAQKQVYPLNKAVINIGREPSNDIVINELVVSGFHAQIKQEGSQFILIHPSPLRPKTLNGLLYQGRHIAGDQPFSKPLARGDIFRIGDEHGTLVTLSFNDGSGAAQEVLPEIHPIPLGAPVITLGRLPNNTVALNHPQVSGNHARMERVGNTYRIVDLGSTNHVYVNAQRVRSTDLKPGDEIRIGPFKLTFTGTELTQHDESNGIRIDALGLKKVGNNNTVLIDDISIAIPPRKFVALVGGSGAGKSTLMDALNGLRPAQTGSVLYNGKDYYHHLAAFSTQLGYVPQDDIIHRDLTVERALYYAARLRLPSDMTKDQIKGRIDEVLEDVDMKHRRHLLVSKLSGGQRKRVSIALELLANPSVFFLDEPTSGLDPGLDRKMMTLLRNLADKGHTIALVTHATNNINSCDYICFLAQGGHLAYFGPPNEAKAYFGKSDFAEIYSALEPTEENPNIPAEAGARFKASPDYQKYVVTPLNQGPAGAGRAAALAQQAHEVVQPKRGKPMKQFRLLCGRYIELLFNDRGNLLILLLQAPIIAAILFLLTASPTFTKTSIVTCPPSTYQAAGIPRSVFIQGGGGADDCQNVLNFLDRGGPRALALLSQHNGDKEATLQPFIQPASGGDAQKILFIMAFAAVMFGCINGAREIVKEEPIYRRERTVNLGIAPYLFSKIVVLGVLCLLQSVVLVIVVNLKATFPQKGLLLPSAFIEVYISMLLTSIAGLMMGLTVSALAPNNDRATSFIPIILIPQVIFSGIIFSLDTPVMQFFGSFFAARWAMAAMGSTVGLHSQFVFPNGDKTGEDFSYQGTLFSTHSQTAAALHLLLCWGALILMSVLLGLATAHFLKRKDVRR
ncbi:MAG TPA: FHA domain-containing protein [Ktedonobacteraceae bacterium]|nr:FHA domain-containing protein [Ktedonobacteraceae bacterium]